MDGLRVDRLQSDGMKATQVRIPDLIARKNRLPTLGQSDHNNSDFIKKKRANQEEEDSMLAFKLQSSLLIPVADTVQARESV